MAHQQQILLHCGFHRTGTSSMQHFLWLNREALAPALTVRLTRHFKPVAKICSRYAKTQNPLDLTDLIDQLDHCFAQDPVPTDRNLIISSETFCGEIPGRDGITSYEAAPTLIAYVAGYMQERFPAAAVRVIMTTRAADDWLYSVYRHILRASRVTLTRSEFEDAYRSAADLDAVVAEIAAAIDPVETLFLPLELAVQSPLGPGAALLDQIPLPDGIRAKLQPVGHSAKAAEPHIWGQFLAMNRSDLSDAVIRTQKEQLAETAKLGHWRRS